MHYVVDDNKQIKTKQNKNKNKKTQPYEPDNYTQFFHGIKSVRLVLPS